MTKKKYIIFSPINEYGGVNLEVGFLAQIITQENNDVRVISLGDFHENSSVFFFNKALDYTSLNQIIYTKKRTIKLVTDLLQFIKPLAIPSHFRISNAFTKLPLFNIEKIKNQILEGEIQNADKILICSQLTSKYNKEIIAFAKKNNKEIFFRTTGAITTFHLKQDPFIWLKDINVIIYHSQENRRKLEELLYLTKHIVIDQNAYLEEKLLQIPLQKKEVRNFFTLSRLHSIKQIGLVIEAFKKIGNKNLALNIYGDGEKEVELKKMVGDFSSIHFHGKVDFENTPQVFMENDCLIIASQIEAGPYTGIEAMASGTLIISTRVGAMTERLGKDYEYFFDGSQAGLVNKIKQIINLPPCKTEAISESIRKFYLSRYTEAEIRRRYLEAFSLD